MIKKEKKEEEKEGGKETGREKENKELFTQILRAANRKYLGDKSTMLREK